MHLAEGIGDEGIAPELDAAVGRAFEADAIDGGDVDAVGDGVGALDGAPGVELRRAVLRFFRRVPADGRGIEENVRAAQAGQARAFGIPLVPADQRGDAAEARVEAGKAEVAGREVELFVVERIVGDVHLAVDAGEAAVGVEDRGGVVVEAGGAALEERSDDDDAQFARRAFASASVVGPGMGSARSKLS